MDYPTREEAKQISIEKCVSAMIEAEVNRFTKWACDQLLQTGRILCVGGWGKRTA